VTPLAVTPLAVTPLAGRLPGRDAVQYLIKGPECRARPAPHAASAPQDRGGRAAGGAARVQRLVQLDQPQPEVGEAEHPFPGLGKEGEVKQAEPGRHGNHPVPVDEPRVVAACLEPARGALGVETDRLQMFPQPLAGLIWRFLVCRARIGRAGIWRSGIWPSPISRARTWLSRVRPARRTRDSGPLCRGEALLACGEGARRWRRQLRTRVRRGMPGRGLPLPLLVRPLPLLVRPIWLRVHRRGSGSFMHQVPDQFRARSCSLGAN
jgi:hypothetical protein